MRTAFWTLCFGVFLVVWSSPFQSAVAQSIVQTDTSAANQTIPKIEIVGVADERLENVKRSLSLLNSAVAEEPITELELDRLRKQAIPEIKRALEPFGYYQISVEQNFLAADNVLKFTVDLGAPTLVSDVNLELTERASKAQLPDNNFASIFQTWSDTFSLNKGSVLDHRLYEAEKKNLLSRAFQLGYFDARFTQKTVNITESLEEASIHLTFSPGDRYQVGDVSMVWAFPAGADEKSRRGIEVDLIEPLVAFKKGDFYDAEKLAKTQRDLAEAPYFSRVDVRVITPERSSIDANTNEAARDDVPVVITLTPLKRKVINFETGVGTDTGVRASVGYENRRVNTHAHSIAARLGGSEISRNAILNYRVPQFRQPSQSLNYFLSRNETFSDTRRFEETKVGAEIKRPLNGGLLTFGVTASREDFTRLLADRVEDDSQVDLLIPRVHWQFSTVDDRYFPTKGWSTSLEFRGMSDELFSDVSLLQGQWNVNSLLPAGSGRMKLRFGLSTSLIDDALDLPESLGFLVGGDDSVRGYDFESIGVERNGVTSVGKHAVTASVEYQHPVRNAISVATFIDVGDAFDSNISLKRGAGVGLRWRLPFGALRLDVASALDRDGNPLRLHFSFGTDL